VSGPAGYVIPIHQHEREHEGFYVAEGLVTLFLGDEVRPLEVGGFGFAPAGFDHSFRLDSDDARLVLLITPGAAGHEGMFAEMGEPASGPGLPPPSDVMPDPEALGAIAARHGTIITGPPPGA
jgi:hypothetical protein